MKHLLKSNILTQIFTVVAVVPCIVFSAAIETRAQSGLEIAPFIRAKGSYNVINTALTTSEFIINNSPDIGVVFQLPVNSHKTEYLGLEIGYLTYSARNLSINPFGGQALTNFSLKAHLHYLSIAGVLRISDLILFSIGYSTPLSGTYRTTVDLFSTGKALDGEEEHLFSVDTMRKTIDLRLGAVLLRFPVAKQHLEFSLIGGYTLTTISQSVSIFDRAVIPGQIGSDPLAGLRNLGIQPLTISLGISYIWGL